MSKRILKESDLKKGKYIPKDIIFLGNNVIQTGYYEKVIYKEDELFLVSGSEIFNYKYDEIENYLLIDGSTSENIQANFEIKFKYYGRM